MLLLGALGRVPSSPHKGTLGTSEVEMVVSTEVLFLATLCPLCPSGVGRERV